MPCVQQGIQISHCALENGQWKDEERSPADIGCQPRSEGRPGAEEDSPPFPCPGMLQDGGEGAPTKGPQAQQ